jgi:hypothetical protein
VPESQKIAPLFELMREQRNHMSLVADEYGQLSGMKTWMQTRFPDYSCKGWSVCRRWETGLSKVDTILR